MPRYQSVSQRACRLTQLVVDLHRRRRPRRVAEHEHGEVADEQDRGPRAGDDDRGVRRAGWRHHAAEPRRQIAIDRRGRRERGAGRSPSASAQSSSRVRRGHARCAHAPRRTRKPPDIATTTPATTSARQSESIARTQRGGRRMAEACGRSAKASAAADCTLSARLSTGTSARFSTAMRFSISAPNSSVPTGPLTRAPRHQRDARPARRRPPRSSDGAATRTGRRRPARRRARR